MGKFEDCLIIGTAGESAIAKWMRKRGDYVLPVYEKIIDNGKGPRLYTPSGELIAPDILAMTSKGITWIEAKHKSGFTWYRAKSVWETGIDLKHYFDYIKIAKSLPYPVFLLFLQAGEATKDCPHDKSPAGLYGGEILSLSKKESHRSDRHGSTGMVYWEISALKKYAEYSDVINCY